MSCFHVKSLNIEYSLINLPQLIFEVTDANSTNKCNGIVGLR